MCSAPLEFIYIPTASVAKDNGDCEVLSQNERISIEPEQPTLSQSCRWSSEPRTGKGRKRISSTIGPGLSRRVSPPFTHTVASQYDPIKQPEKVFHTKTMPPKRPRRTQSMRSIDAKSLDAAIAAWNVQPTTIFQKIEHRTRYGFRIEPKLAMRIPYLQRSAID